VAWCCCSSPALLRSVLLLPTDMLTFPHTWGPTEWGPIPYLPSEDVLVKRMEKQWGSLHSYRGINSTTRGTLLIPGVQLGKLWIGVQPLLGLEGDPMRLLFERDLTPHPQYAAAYKWLQEVSALVTLFCHSLVDGCRRQVIGCFDRHGGSPQLSFSVDAYGRATTCQLWNRNCVMLLMCVW